MREVGTSLPVRASGLLLSRQGVGAFDSKPETGSEPDDYFEGHLGEGGAEGLEPAARRRRRERTPGSVTRLLRATGGFRDTSLRPSVCASSTETFRCRRAGGSVLPRIPRDNAPAAQRKKISLPRGNPCLRRRPRPGMT